MLKKLMTFIIFSVLLLLSACGGTSTNVEPNEESEGNTSEENNEASEEMEPVTFRLAHVATEQNSLHQGLSLFAERVSELTDGVITIDIYPGGQIGGDRDSLENTANGSLSMSAPAAGQLSHLTPVLSGIGMPFLIKNLAVEKALYESDLIKVDAFKEIEKLNLKPLTMVSNDFFQFGTNSRPVYNLEDLQGLSLRSSETQMLLDAQEALGINPTAFPYGEMYSALQTGVVDGGALQLNSWINEKMVEVVQHISLVNFVPWPHILLMNLEEFNSLPKKYQEALQQAANEAGEYMFELNPPLADGFIQEMKDMGLTVVEEGEFDRTGIEERLQPVIDKYKAEDPMIERTFDLIQELNSQY